MRMRKNVRLMRCMIQAVMVIARMTATSATNMWAGKLLSTTIDYVQPKCALKASVSGNKVNSRSSQIPPWEVWHSIKYAHHTVKQGPIHVPLVTQDDVFQDEVPLVSAAPSVANSPPDVFQVSNPDLSKIKL